MNRPYAKEADLAGPGIGDYAVLEHVLPDDYEPLLSPRETMEALYPVKRLIEDRLCEELGLTMVQVPLIVDTTSGVNDYLDRDGSRTPVGFHISNDRDLHPIDAEVVQAATKWKRMALRQFGFEPGEGLLTDMRAVRKDYFLDHDHSAYVDQWDWEKAITAEERTLEYLTRTVRGIWKVLKEAEAFLHEHYPRSPITPPCASGRAEFLHAEDILAAYPDLPRKERETRILQEHPAVFIYGIGWPLADGYPHELRAADYDDWSTETTSADGRPMHGLNGDILVWNPGYAAPARAPVRRDPGDEGLTRPPARALGPARLPRTALPPGDRQRRDPALDRRGNRPVADDDAPAAEGAPRRGERDRLAAGAQGHVRPQEHPRPRVTP